ncbi:MAG: hypothetical protein HQL47_10290 [Gammaproteobacteria bacterium]|nr:hypothetical protein [Gammaproteobacteria bacterium]
MPVSLVRPCPPLKPPPGPELGQLLQAYVKMAGLYHQCTARQRALARWVTEDLHR